MIEFRRDGISRFVVLVGPWAIKLARFRHYGKWWIDNGLAGMLANRCENRLGKKGTAFPGLCPSLWCSPFGMLQIMRRACAIDPDEQAQFEGAKAALVAQYQGMIEDKWSSFGLLGDVMVAVDYGS